LSVLDHAPEPVVVLDRDWVIRFVNRAGVAITAAGEAAALTGRRLFDILPELRGTPFQSHVEQALAGVPVDFESYHAPSDRWYAIAAHPVPEGVAIFASDASAERRRISELETVNARLAAVLNSAPDLVIALDRNLRVLAFNGAYGRTFGEVFGRAIHVADDFRALLADFPGALAESIPHWERAAVHGEEFTVHCEIGAPGSPARVFHVRYGILRDASGNAIGAVASMNDVTESVRDRSALTELTERLEAVIRFSPDRVVGVDQSLRVVAMNEGARDDFATLWGVPIAVGDSLREKLLVLPAEQRDAAIAMWERAIGGNAPTQFSVFGKTPEAMRAYEISFGALRNSKDGPAGAVMLAKDVTDRERALTALRESEGRFRTLGEAAPIGIFLADAQGHCTYANPCLQRIWDQREATLLTLGFASRVHVDDERIAESWLGFGGGGHDFRGEFRLVLGDGVERWVLAHSAAIRDDAGAVVGRVGTIDDITDARRDVAERLQLEQKLLHAQKLESLEVLAGGIAHDFNNLLVGVLGNAGLALLDLPPESPAYAPVVDIERAGQRASDLTRQMLAYSGRGRFVVEPVDISELVSEMGALLRTVLSKQAVLAFELQPSLPLIEADATQLRQVVMNLITNASDAVGETGGMIHVRTGDQRLTADTDELTYLGDRLPAGEYVFVEVSDTGEGMSEATVARVFDPFFTTKFTGRGLGLAATLGIVRGHRGGISIQSAPGHGSTFRILLPVGDVLMPPAPLSAPPAHGSGVGTVLIIDDDETVRVVARRLLERRGFQVVVAVDGFDGLDRFREAPAGFDLVILDLTMPRMGGVETLAALRRLEPDVLVLLTSGYREREVAAQFVGREPAGFVQKPFRAEELYSAVSHALQLA